MIGIVVVSHSRRLAVAAVGLAAEMVQAEQLPRIEIAAGLDESTLGTDAAAVAEAITTVDSTDGVLVLLDLGSAILSAEMALELVDPIVAGRVHLSSAPLVEGLVAAVVTASGGADLGTVRAEAERGLSAKRNHLDGPAPAAASSTADASGQPVPMGEGALRRELLIGIPHGLHARPAARFVGCVNAFPGTDVQVRNLDGSDRVADATSLSAVATLNIQQGHRVEVRAAGPRASDVLDALAALVDEEFGDPAEPDSSARPPAPSAQAPEVIPAGQGSGLEAAMGAVARPEVVVEVTDYRVSHEEDTERDRLRAAIKTAGSELERLAVSTRTALGAAEAEVFAAHRALLHDAALARPARDRISEGMGAAQAWQEAGEVVAAQFDQLSDEYQRQRAQDVRSVTQRVLRRLVDPDGQGESGMTTADRDTGPQVLVMNELDPATAATLSTDQAAGVLTLGGGSTGHGVIIATARGIPVLTGISGMAGVPVGTVVAFDTRDGTVLVDPSGDERADFEKLLDHRLDEQEADLAAAHRPGRTKDGRRVRIEANVTTAAEAAHAVSAGAEGSGLVRTEVLFGRWACAPTVAEQVSELTAIARALQGRPMTIRTWDIGADKPLSFWTQQPEQNPFLGVRGLRSFTSDPTLLRDQLQAVCRVAHDHPVRVMFPMVTTVEEVQWALTQLDEAAAHVEAGRPEGLEVGIMVEVPSAALRAEAMTAELDFVSIGTNDLTQYTVAAERGNAGVDHLFDPVDPAVLRLVEHVCLEVADGVRVGVCGGAASDPATAALLVGLGVDDLSATPVAVPRVKALLGRHTSAELADLADRALRCDSAGEVRELLAPLRDP